MSFVSEPYAEIVDSLLTSLTGGEVYEENVFDPDKISYSLVNTSVYPKKIKIFGSLGLDYHKFVLGKDYELELENKEVRICWMKGEDVNLPDKGTPFYINYYPSEGNLNPLLTDRNVGSVTRLFAESFAREFALFSKRLENVYHSGYVDTAEGRSLDQVVAILGLERKTAQYAMGNVVFLRDTPAPADIVIPENYFVSTQTEPVKTYQTTTQKRLRKGQLSITVSARATVKGEEGLVAADEITLMNQPLLGIDRINNPNSTTFGTEPETDEQLRKRAKSQLERTGKTTLNALKYALLAIRAQSGYSHPTQLRENDIKIEEDFTQGPGLVRILLDADEENPDLVCEVNRAIFETRAAGVMVVHNLNIPVTGGDTGLGSDEASESAMTARSALDASEEVASGGEEEKPIVDLKKIKVSLRLIISLLDISLSEEEKSKLASKVRESIKGFFDALSIGQKVIINRMINNVLNIEGIQDVVRIKWSAELAPDDVIEGSRLDIHVPTNQKAILSTESNALDIQLAGSPVRIDFTIETTIDGESNLSQSKVKNEIESKLTTHFDTLSDNVNLPKLEKALAGNGYKVTIVSVNVEHTETGLIIRNIQDKGTVINIAEHEIAVIGMVRIDLKGGVESA